MYECYINLLIAVIKQAEAEARGSFVYYLSPKRKAAAQAEAQRWLAEDMPQLAIWAHRGGHQRKGAKARKVA